MRFVTVLFIVARGFAALKTHWLATLQNQILHRTNSNQLRVCLVPELSLPNAEPYVVAAGV